MSRIPHTLAAALLVLPISLRAQQSAPPATGEVEAVRLFLDCQSFHCDSDYYRTEVGFVSHVRSRQDADVHVLITPQQTGGGGTEYTLTFLGQHGFQGRNQELRHVVSQTATETERRSGLARLIKIGLVDYLAKTPVADHLQVSYTPPTRTNEAVAGVRDPWDHWTFRSRINGFFNGESRTRFESLSGSVSANRVTEEWKTQLSVNGNRRSSRFEISDSKTVTSEQNGYGFNGLIARSLGPHFSAGVRAMAESSTFLNQNLRLRFAPALEYNIFPYAESTRRQLTVQYSLGPNYFDYREQTIFGRSSQSMLDHTVLGSLDLKQRWGSMNISIEGAQYLHDTERYRADLLSDLDVRLLKGLSLNLFGNLSYVRDQIYLPAGGATTEEILLRLRQLETSYRYFASVGISYTFGSAYNNVVNPRFGAGRGGVIRF